MRPSVLLAASSAVPFLVPASFADTIYLTNGKTIADVQVQSELLDLVTYREGRERRDVRSDEVLAIEYAQKPRLVDQAEAALADENYAAAADDLEQFIADTLSKPPRRYPWSPAYAMYRLVELYETVQEVDLMVTAADKLIANAGDSRYAPLVYLKKADALYDHGKGNAARKTLDDFGQLVSQQRLGRRWELEHELRTLLYDDSLTGGPRMDKLEDVADRAGAQYPVVRNRAEVARGEALFKAKRSKDAEKVFRDVTSDPKADVRTLAAAFVGLGDCLYQRAGAISDDEERLEVLREALFAYMRVVVVYKQELRYVPKAMFYAGRSFDLIGDEQSKDRAQALYNRVYRTFKGTRWADEARSFRKKKRG